MLYLSDVRDYVATLGLTLEDHVYSGVIPDKKIESIGIYNQKRGNPARAVIGGRDNESYRIKAISILVHWSKSQRDTERKANELFDKLQECREVTINEKVIKFIKTTMGEPIDVGADDNGIYEMVIEVDFYYER